MYESIQILHSYWAYLVLLIVFLATINAIVKYFSKRNFIGNDLRISLFAVIVTHLQLLIGIVLWFISPLGFNSLKEKGMAGLSSFARQMAVEHPFVGILAVIFITIGFSKHKKKQTPNQKFKTLSIFYVIGLILILSRIPWNTWFN